MSASHADAATLSRPAPCRRSLWLSLPFLLVVSWACYELTSQPSLAAMLLCLKFGWEDFRTGWWLRRTDPLRPRGAAGFWLYTSWGLWKAVLAALAMMVVVVVAEAHFGPRLRGPGAPPAGRQGPILMFVGAFGTVLLGLLLACLTGIRALGIANRHGLRLWLNGGVEFARRGGEWPPLYGSVNRLRTLLFVVAFTFYFALVPIAAGMGFWMLRRAGLPAGPQVFGLLMVFYFFLACPVLILKTVNALTRRLFAEYPDEAWEPAPADAE